MRSPHPVGVVALLATIFAGSACGSGAPPSPVPSAGATPTTAPAPTETGATPSLPAATVGSSTGTAIHLVKDCSTFTTESYCEISASDFAAIPVGGKVVYLGPVLDNPYFLSSKVRIDDAHGNTANGYCIFDGRPTEERGFCTFWDGTGSLTGFTAILKVTIDAVGEWHLDGEYYGSPPSPGPS